MKWFYLIISMLAKRFTHMGSPDSDPIETMKEFMKENAVKIFLAFSAASALGTLLVSGIVLTIVNLSAQYDAGLQPRFSAVVASGVGITLVALSIFAIGIYYATTEKREMKRKEKRQEKSEHEGHPLEHALMLLVNDFIEERQLKRELKREFKEAHPTPQSPLRHPPHPHPRPQHEEMNFENYRSSEEFERH
jgi:hypothetical protein